MLEFSGTLVVFPLQGCLFLGLCEDDFFGLVVVQGVKLGLLRLRLDILLHLVLEQTVQLLNILHSTKSFLFNLIDLVEPKSTFGFSVYISLSFFNMCDV